MYVIKIQLSYIIVMKSLHLIDHVGGMPHNAKLHNATPYNTMPHNATPHVSFCTLFYSRMNIQILFIKIHKVKSSKCDWLLCRCVDRDLWELRLYCKYYTQKDFILEWIFKCHLLKSTKWNLQSMTGLYVDVLTKNFESYSFIANITLKKILF